MQWPGFVLEAAEVAVWFLAGFFQVATVQQNRLKVLTQKRGLKLRFKEKVRTTLALTW